MKCHQNRISGHCAHTLLRLLRDKKTEGLYLGQALREAAEGETAYGDVFNGEVTAEIVLFNTAFGPRHPVGGPS